MKYGARNKIVGRVTKVKKGSVMAQADMAVQGPIALSSVMTVDSLRELNLKKGDRVRIVVKAINVLVIKE